MRLSIAALILAALCVLCADELTVESPSFAALIGRQSSSYPIGPGAGYSTGATNSWLTSKTSESVTVNSAGSNRLLLVFVAVSNSTVSGVTFNTTQAMSRVTLTNIAANVVSATAGEASMWKLLNPDVANASVTASFDACINGTILAALLTNAADVSQYAATYVGPDNVSTAPYPVTNSFSSIKSNDLVFTAWVSGGSYILYGPNSGQTWLLNSTNTHAEGDAGELQAQAYSLLSDSNSVTSIWTNTAESQGLGTMLSALVTQPPYVAPSPASAIPTNNLEFWYSGLSLSGADDSSVTTWTDSSPWSRSLSQATAGNRPTLKTTAGPNSRPCVRFNGTDQWLTNSHSGFSWSNAYVFAVAKYQHGDQYDRYWSIHPVGGTDELGILAYDFGSGAFTRVALANGGFVKSLADTTNAWFCFQIRNTNAANCFVYGNASYINGGATVDTNLTATATTLGVTYTAGAPTGTYLGQMDIAELFFYSDIPSAANYLVISNYIATNYSVNIVP